VVDSALVAVKIAAVADATARIRAVLPPAAETFIADRTVIPSELATRLGAAAAFRNLVAHQYGVLDGRRVYALATSELGDLDTFCAILARYRST
jgi:uncharacterized protein YutE (UPF0331/DUF86 family)